MLTDEQIFDILDGDVSAEIWQKHKHLLANSEEYRVNFTEIEALHFDLAGMSLEQPSTQFTENILANIQWEKVAVKKKSWSNKLIYVFIGVMTSILLATIIFTLLYSSTPKTTILEPNYWLEKTITFLTDTFTKVTVLVNLVVLLLFFDRKVLKPYFNHRKMSLN